MFYFQIFFLSLFAVGFKKLFARNSFTHASHELREGMHYIGFLIIGTINNVCVIST